LLCSGPRTWERNHEPPRKTAALGSDVGARRDSQAADETGAQVADDVTVEIRQDEHVIQLGLLHQLHAHVVDDAILKAILPSYCAAIVRQTVQEEAVRELHDVGLVDGRDLATTVGDGVLEGKSGDPLRSGPGDDL